MMGLGLVDDSLKTSTQHGILPLDLDILQERQEGAIFNGRCDPSSVRTLTLP